MNMTEEQKARVIANCEVIAKALRDGKQLQFRCEDDGIVWEEDQYGEFNASPHIEYRIKPEPRTIWVNEYGAWAETFSSADDARKNSTAPVVRIAVEYREVVK